jgi:hypothetical protein
MRPYRQMIFSSLQYYSMSPKGENDLARFDRYGLKNAYGANVIGVIEATARAN